MFKSVRWRSEKNKITAVFKLRFHATKVSQLGGNELVLSLVPADTGKPTAKLEKYEIRDGCCYWESTIFETVKFVQDPKTGKIHDRVYNCIISTGSSKSSVSLNISEYAAEIKAASVSLPFKGSNSDATLHVLIQRIQENVNQRELEEDEGEKFNPEDKSFQRDFSNGDTEENINMDSSTGEEHLMKTVSNIAELNGNTSGSIGSDITLSSSDSSSGLNTPRENGLRSNSMLSDSVAHQQRTQWELLVASGHDLSTDDFTNSSTDAFPNGRPQMVLDLSVEKLKSYLVLLSRKAEVADLELQTLRKQIVKERKRGQDLLEEVACLKLERDALKEECEKFKATQKGEDDLKDINKSWALLEETRRELNNEKDLNVSLQLQLEKVQETNSELILSVQDLKQRLEQSKRGNLDPSAKQESGTISENLEERCAEVAEGQGLSDDDEEQKALEEIVRQHTDAKETYILEQKVMDLRSEIEMYRRDKDQLEMQMEHLALDYEILKQENHVMSHKLDQSHLQEQLELQYECSGSFATTNESKIRVKELERELKEQSNELNDSLATIKKLENHVHNLEHELERQAQGFKDEWEVVTRGQLGKEQQAISAQEVLNLAKLELEGQIKMLEGDLKQKSKQHSDALATIMELEDYIQSLEEELDKWTEGFESDLEALTHAKVEQEQRAIRAEEALRLTRWKNANTAGRIQDEFKRLCMQMQSTFEANEKVATKAMTEASELRLINSHLEESVQQTREELQLVKDDYESQVDNLHDQLTSQSKQIKELLNQLNHKKEPRYEICQGRSAELLMLRAAEKYKIASNTASLAAQIEQGGDLKVELGQVKALMEGRDLLVQRKRMETENLEFTVDSANKEGEKSMEELNTVRCSKNEKDMVLLNLQSEVNSLKAHCEELRHPLLQDELEKDKLRSQAILLEAELKEKDDALTGMERNLKNNNGWAALAERTKACSEESTADLATCISEEATSLKEKIRMLEGLIKKKEIQLETSANAFGEKEKDLWNKIKELEKRFEELNHSSTAYCEYECRMVDDGNMDGFVLNDNSLKPVDGVTETLSNRVKENGIQLSTSTTMNPGDELYELCDMLKEMTSLRANNTSMENELKEMQERYSEMSLKFAEVEGERQMLVMALRSMKNVRKI